MKSLISCPCFKDSQDLCISELAAATLPVLGSLGVNTPKVALLPLEPTSNPKLLLDLIAERGLSDVITEMLPVEVCLTLKKNTFAIISNF
jgi:hypothetical protein